MLAKALLFMHHSYFFSYFSPLEFPVLAWLVVSEWMGAYHKIKYLVFQVWGICHWALCLKINLTNEI